MRTFISVVLCVLFAAVYADGGVDPVGLFLPFGKGTYLYQGHRYTFHTERITWEEAAVVCRKTGGYLAVLEDMQEAEFVAEAMASNLCNYIALQNIWVGGRYVEGRWMWVPTGQEIPGKIGADGYPPWAVNVRPDKNCLVVARTFLNRPKLVDVNCERKRNFLCEQGCAQLYDSDRHHWEPATCAEDLSDIGDSCKLVCNGGYELSGSAELTCTANGWNSSTGFNNLPSCRTPDELGGDFVDQINRTLGNVKANLLFLLDESVSVSPAQFEMEKNFVKAVIKAFPLSVNRTAGLITFSHVAAVDIAMRQTVTCDFLTAVSKLVYTKGGTDILTALQVAITEIQRNAVHNLTLVFLITDGISVRNPAPAATAIKDDGNIMFSLGIAHYLQDELEPLASLADDGRPHFFGVSSFEVFDSIATYLNTTYANNNNLICNVAANMNVQHAVGVADGEDGTLTALS